MSGPFLFVTGGLGPGGSERQLLYLVRGLRAMGSEVAVAVWNFREEDVYTARIRACGVQVVEVPGVSRAAKMVSLRAIILAGDYMVVQSFSFYLNAVVAVAAWGTRTMAVGSVRSTLSRAATNAGAILGRCSARWPRRQIYNNMFAAREARKRRWWRPTHIVVVANHIDARAVRRIPASLNAHMIVGIGSLLPVKRWDRLVRALRILKSRGLQFSAVIVGDGPLRSKLEQEIASADLSGSVKLLGYIADVERLLAQCAFLVHVSDSEGSPNVVMEALACGRPVVATNVGDIPELVRDGETGFIVPPQNEEMLADRMAALLEDGDRRIAMGHEAWEFAMRRFGSSSLASETIAAYEELGRS